MLATHDIKSCSVAAPKHDNSVASTHNTRLTNTSKHEALHHRILPARLPGAAVALCRGRHRADLVPMEDRGPRTRLGRQLQRGRHCRVQEDGLCVGLQPRRLDYRGALEVRR